MMRCCIQMPVSAQALVPLRPNLRQPAPHLSCASRWPALRAASAASRSRRCRMYSRIEASSAASASRCLQVVEAGKGEAAGR